MSIVFLQKIIYDETSQLFGRDRVHLILNETNLAELYESSDSCGIIHLTNTKETEISMKPIIKTAALMLALVFSFSALFSCAKKPLESNADVIASIGDQKVTLGLFKSAFTSYADYYAQMGTNPYASKTELERFQDMVFDAVVNDAVVLHHASKEGFVLSESDKAEVERSAAEELEQMRNQLMSQAEQMSAEDGSKSVQQCFDELVREMSEYYTGSAMNFDEYSAEYLKQSLDSALVSLYRDEFEKTIAVSDAELAEWYEKQLESDKKMYAEDPGKYMENSAEYQLYGEQYADISPPVFVPEGFGRVYDIVVYPSEELSEEYESIMQEMNSLSEQCSAMLFSDALSGTQAHAQEIDQLIAAYKQLEAQSTEMYEQYQASARKKIDDAYALLIDGESFVEVMKRYTEANYVGSDHGVIPQDVIEKGELISTEYDCGSSDWSTTFKEVYSMTAKGEFSSVFSDEDGSLHILMRGDDEPSGSVEIDSVKDAIVRIIRREKSNSEWQSMIAKWREDPALHVDMEAVRKVGADKLSSEIGE